MNLNPIRRTICIYAFLLPATAIALHYFFFHSSSLMSSSLVSPSKNELRVCASGDEVAANLFEVLKQTSTEAIQARGAFHVALSGGSLPATLSKALFDASGAPRLDVSAWHWWFADERCVKKNDPDSNYAESNKHVFSKLAKPIPAKQMHAIDEEKVANPEECAKAYESELRSVIPSGSFDLILLGMGPDGHCCSLFPGHALLKENSKWITHITDSPKPPPARITMTLPLLKLAKYGLFVATGSSKADALQTIVRERSELGSANAKVDTFLPSSRVQSQQVSFLVDKEAAPKVEQQQPKL